MIKKLSFLLLASLATLVGLYPVIYFIIDRRFGLLGSKSEALLANTVWNAAFYSHILTGGLALLIGWTQFVPKWRSRYPGLHRQTGKLYVFLVLVSGSTSLYIALFATGGLVPAVGFICMGAVWLFTTLKGYAAVRNRNIAGHQKMMLYSYATCLAAVTLRIYLPLFIAVFNDFTKAYAVVAWLSWVPNLFVAHALLRYLQPGSITIANEPAHSYSGPSNIV